jgi:hypothetical protein
MGKLKSIGGSIDGFSDIAHPKDKPNPIGIENWNYILFSFKIEHTIHTIASFQSCKCY